MLTIIYGRDIQGAKGAGDIYLGYMVNHTAVEVDDFESLVTVIHELRTTPNAYVIRGKVKEGLPPKIRRRFKRPPYHLEDEDHQWLCVDIDGMACAIDVFEEPERAVDYARSTLPAGLAKAICYYAITRSAERHSLHVHLWFWLDRPYSNAEVMRDLAGRCDKSLYKPTQPHFTADPVVHNDPLAGRRRGVLPGELAGYLGAEPLKADPAAAEAQLQSAMNDIVAAKKGNRHATVNRRAFHMGKHVATGAIDRLRVIETLVAAAQSADLSESRARDEVCRALADGIVEAPNRDRWLDKLEMNKDGTRRSTYFNSIVSLSESGDWHGCLGYSTRHARTEWLRSPPIVGGYASAVGGMPLRDEHAAVAAEWLSARGMSYNRRAIIDAMIDVSHKNPFDPLLNTLEELDWDGQERLTDMLLTYFGVPKAKADWARLIARKWMVSAIARVYDPGCKADNILILEGEQGLFKSTALEVLGMGYSKEVRVRLDDKDASDALHSGVWIAVLSELDAFKATSRIEAVKAFITMQEDYYRQAYARTTQTFARSIVFAATTNEEAYLNDPTGNRRFWPIAVGDICLDALREDVEQLWAEARQAYLSGERWWIETKDERDLASKEQRRRLLPDSWEAYVMKYIKGRDFVTVEDLLENGLEMVPAQQSPPTVSRVTRYLRRHGFGIMIRNGQKVYGRLSKD